MTSRTYKFAIIGAGYMATRHIACIENSPNAEVAIVVNKGQVVRNRLGASYASSANHDALMAALRDDDRIDGIVLCSPDHTHPDYLSQLLPSSKAILCEKPLARTEEEFRRILQVIGDSKVMVGMNCRFRTKVQFLKTLIQDGGCKEVRLIRATYYSNIAAIIAGTMKTWWSQYPKGVIPFLHGGAIHLFDALRFLMGEVREVSCTSIPSATLRSLGGADFLVTMRFASQAVAGVAISGTSLGPNRFEIQIDADGCAVDGTNVYTRDPASDSPRCIALPADDPHDLARQLTHVIDVIEGRATPLNSVDEAYRNFHLIEACQDSATSGNWVAVNR
jgi:predicted dehydrogenase